MSKFHRITIGENEFTVRDVPIPPFDKKFRVAPIELKDIILDKLSKNENLRLLRYVNTRIHFFVDFEFKKMEDAELSDILQNNLQFKNDLHI